MRRGPFEKSGYVHSNKQFKKSLSMETRTNQDPTKDLIKPIPSKQILESNSVRILESREPLSIQSSNQSDSLKRGNLLFKPGNDKLMNSKVKANKVNQEPKTVQAVASFDSNHQNTQARMKPSMNTFVKRCAGNISIL